MDADILEAALLKAIEDNVISASVEAGIPTILTTLAAARLDRAVPAVNPETTTLGAVLTAASLAAGVPRAFAEEYLSHTGTVSEFWAGPDEQPQLSRRTGLRRYPTYAFRAPS